MGHVLEGGEVGGGVIGADAAFVVAEDHVHHPVQTVFDRPMTADDGADLTGEPGERGDVEAGFALDLVADFALSFDHVEVPPMPSIPLFSARRSGMPSALRRCDRRSRPYSPSLNGR